MIIKYWDCGKKEWIFIDECREVSVKILDEKDLEKQYNGLYPDSSGYDPASEGIVENSSVLFANKIFWLAAQSEHSVCAIEPNQIGLNATKRIGFMYNGRLESIITNMAAYLLNGDGRTIEKLN